MIIGITGRGGTGKSTIAKKLAEINKSFEYIEVDLLVEKYVLNSKRLLNNVNSNFTDRVYSMYDIVSTYFKEDEKSKKIHKMFVLEVEKVLNDKINNSAYNNFIVDWFLLHEMELFNNMDIKILIELELSERINRVRERTKTKNLEKFLLIDKYYRDDKIFNYDFIINTKTNEYINDLKKVFDRKIK